MTLGRPQVSHLVAKDANEMDSFFLTRCIRTMGPRKRIVNCRNFNQNQFITGKLHYLQAKNFHYNCTDKSTASHLV